MPDGFDPLVAASDPVRTTRIMSELAAAVTRTVDAMPTHEAFLRSVVDSGAPA